MQVLTLVSNERIPLTPSMRLLLEVSHMRNASPATASRGGVLSTEARPQYVLPTEARP